VFDFPTTPATGTVVTVPDGSYRVWDSQKWRASPSANVVIPPTGFLPLTGGMLTGATSVQPPSPMSYPAGASTETPIFLVQGSFTGTTSRTGTFAHQNWINTTGDNAALGASGANTFRIEHHYGGPAFTGGRVGLNVLVAQTTSGAYPGAVDPANTHMGRIAASFTVQASENAGGTDVTNYHASQGSNYCISTALTMFGPGAYNAPPGISGATNYNDAIAQNMNIRVDPGASATQVAFFNLALTSRHQTHGQMVDSFFLIGRANNNLSLDPDNPSGPLVVTPNVGMRSVFLMTNPQGQWPLDPAGWFVDVAHGTGLSRLTAQGFLNWKDVEVTGNLFTAPGFSVSGQGGMNLGALSIATSGTTTTVDTNRIHVTAATVTASVGAWSPEMGMYDTLGNQWKAVTVDGANHLLTVALVGQAHITGTGPATVNVISNGGGQPGPALSGGSTATLALTWSTAGSLSVQPSGGATVFGGPVNYTATGSTTPRSAQDRAADVVNVKDFGAVFDGNSHPLSAYYPTLAAAQAVYPHAVALTDEIDGVAIQAAINLCQSRVTNFSYGGTVQLPCGNGMVNQPLAISKQNVSLISQGAEFLMNSNVVRATPSAPTRLTWTGAPVTAGSPQNRMLTVAPTDGGRLLSGTNVRGILFYCNTVAGTAGVVIASVRYATIEVGAWEPAGVSYAGASLTVGSQAITVSSTAGLRVGESVVSASLPAGAFVASITDATHFNASAQATATSTETVTIGGEGLRFDVVDSLADSNDTQYLRVRFMGYALAGAANATAPLMMIGGSSVAGSGAGTHWGNTSLNWFDEINCIYNNGHGFVANNSDHNFHQNLVGQKIGGGAGRLLICNGSLDPHNGPARYHVFNHSADGGLHAGTDTGGFTQSATANRFIILDRQNAAPIPTIGVGASVYVGADNQTVLGFTGGTQAIVSQYPDSTIAGGNARGFNAIDLQTTRIAATQVASGNQSAVLGGISNSATAQYSVVLGGSGNSATASGAVVLGGINNVCSQQYSLIFGNQAVGDLFGMFAFSNGIISSGRRAQYSVQIIRGSSAANTTPVRLTADALTAGAVNTVNVTYSNSAYALAVRLIAVDGTAGSNFYTWTQPLGLLRRNGIAATVAYTAVGTPVTGGAGTTTGIVITEAADTTNGGYSLTFTPPTGNTAIWRVVATVEWTRVDGA
jgi:hypothetical protein